jgi:3-oxoadipate enol-lactonase
MPYAEVNGIRLFHEVAGEGESLVFIHGAAGNHLSWWQQVPAFRQQYRCITIDQRGFGRSEDTTGEGPARYTDDLEALLDSLGVERCSIVAQSLGGRAALGFAVRHSERVRALVMADTWGFFDWPEQQERARALAQATTTPLVHRALAQSFQEREPARTFLYRQIEALNPPRPAVTGTPAGSPTPEDVRRLSIPVLCLVGAEDIVTPPPLIRAFHALLPNTEYVELPGLGHSVYFEDGPRFNEVVGTFLAQHQ